MSDAGQKCDGPRGCGHALSRHNSLGYCRHESRRDGACLCGERHGTSSTAANIAPRLTEGTSK